MGVQQSKLRRPTHSKLDLDASWFQQANQPFIPEQPRGLIVAKDLSQHQASCVSSGCGGLLVTAPPVPSLPPPSLSSNEQPVLVAMFAFNAFVPADSQSQICVEKDDRLRLFGYSSDGDWADVECLRTGERGWVPSNHTSSPLLGNAAQSNVSAVTFQSAQAAAASSRATSGHGSHASLSGVGLDSEKWHHGAIQRSYAEYLLNSGITGSFLVRESESEPGQLTISLRYEGRIVHYRITRDDLGSYYISESNRFPSLSDLVHHHERQADGLPCCLLYPVAVPAASSTKQDGSTARTELDHWELDRTEIVMKHKLGSGQYGIVYEALWKPYNILVAVKTLKEDVTVRDEFLEEARLMKSLRHPNLVELLGVCTREPPYYIVTEFMCNGNLLDYLRNRSRDELTPSMLLQMATQVARGMAYLEQQNFIHRDLAARNCLVGSQYVIKVADFGLARCMERDMTYRAHEGAKFPIKWTAPEGLVYNIFSTKSDVWAFGVLLWEIATYGKTPYPGIELQDVYVFLEKGSRMNRPPGCPEQIFELMLQCWQWSPEQRPTFCQLRNQLEVMLQSGTNSLEEEIAEELARTDLVETFTRGLSKPTTVKSSITMRTGVNDITPFPPLPPRPPPPRRSTSCERILNVITPTKPNSDSLKGTNLSDEGELDSGLGEPDQNVQLMVSPNALNGRRKQSSAVNELHATTDMTPCALPRRNTPGLTSSNTLGRKRAAPRPPRRTTPVKPSIFEIDPTLLDEALPSPSTQTSDNTVLSTSPVLPPPPPPPPIPITPDWSQHSVRDDDAASFPQHPSFWSRHSQPNCHNLPPPPPCCQNANDRMPSLMSASAIFPATTGSTTAQTPSDLSSEAPISNPSTSFYVAKTKPARPTCLPSSIIINSTTHQSICTSTISTSHSPSSPQPKTPVPVTSSGAFKLPFASRTTVSSNISSVPSKQQSTVSVSKSDSRFLSSLKASCSSDLTCGLGKLTSSPATSNYSNSQSVSNEFHDELRKRLRKQSLILQNGTRDESNDCAARPDNDSNEKNNQKPSWFSQAKRPSSKSAANKYNECDKKPNQDCSDAADSKLDTSSGFFTLPRLKPLRSASASTPVCDSMVTVADSNSSTLTKSTVITSITTSTLSTDSTTPAVVRPTAHSRITKDHLPARPRSHRSVVTVQTDSISNTSSVSLSNNHTQKRLSWAGPVAGKATFETTSARTGRFCLPTILSNSSTDLDVITEPIDSHTTTTPNRATLTVQLNDLTSRLTRLSSCEQSGDNIGPTNLSEMEQVIAVADQLEACRLDCSNFIDQASCSARAKFSFRDRYAPLQQLAGRLRTEKTGRVGRMSLLRSAESAVQELLVELSKLTDSNRTDFTERTSKSHVSDNTTILTSANCETTVTS